jgi:D-serine deaminase-like pyridoxal phosphate-dependent protein
MEELPGLAPTVPEGVDTPTAWIELDRVEANIARLQGFADERGVALRPHAKTHKSVEVAQRQRTTGAVGLTVGTLGEAEVFAGAGFDDLFLAYTLWAGGAKGARLRGLHEAVRIAVGIDSGEGARALSDAVRGSRTLPVLVEVDSGGRRTGVQPQRAGELGRAAQDAGLEVLGVFTHGGHAYRGAEAVADAADDEVRSLETAAAALRAEGIEPRVLSAGSTPTARSSARAPVTEERPGTYVYNDRNQVLVGSCGVEDVALFVAATVVSVSLDGQFVIDAGAKALARDPGLGGAPGYASLPAWPDAVVERLNDYHGMVSVPAGSPRPRVGEVLAVMPNHVCPVVDLHETLLVVRDGRVVDRWRTEARSRSG